MCFLQLNHLHKGSVDKSLVTLIATKLYGRTRLEALY